MILDTDFKTLILDTDFKTLILDTDFKTLILDTDFKTLILDTDFKTMILDTDFKTLILDTVRIGGRSSSSSLPRYTSSSDPERRAGCTGMPVVQGHSAGTGHLQKHLNCCKGRHY
jgi:hypothetical protein